MKEVWIVTSDQCEWTKLLIACASEQKAKEIVASISKWIESGEYGWIDGYAIPRKGSRERERYDTWRANKPAMPFEFNHSDSGLNIEHVEVME